MPYKNLFRKERRYFSMKIDFEGARLYVRPGATDLRKGVTGLLAIIENEMHLDSSKTLMKKKCLNCL